MVSIETVLVKMEVLTALSMAVLVFLKCIAEDMLGNSNMYIYCTYIIKFKYIQKQK